MSLKSWIEEFYPVPANEVHSSRAAEHSLKKWLGLRQENLDKHGVAFNENGAGVVAEKGADFTGQVVVFFDISSSTCALCTHFTCRKCVLSKIRGGVACDDANEEESKSDTDPPWFGRLKSVEPMIFWLKKAVAYEASLRQRSITIRDVLVQAANTAQLCGETDPDKVWEFAFSTIRANEEDEDGLPADFGRVVEDAYCDAEAGAKSYGMSVPDYILNVMYPSETLE